MKTKIFSGMLLLALSGFGTGQALATQTFDYSYQLYQGPVVTGSFTGDANGNLITNLSNITASLDGVAFSGSISSSSFDFANRSWISSGAVASFDGTGNNFGFNNGSGSYFYAIPWSNSVKTDAAQALTPTTGYVDYYNGNYNASSWHVAAVAAVPEPETYGMMLTGLGLLGFIAYRRKSDTSDMPMAV